MKIVSIVGARPNFMKVAPVDAAMKAHGGFEHVIVHTGQHYDYEMSKVFFDELAIPAPQHHLGVGSGTHAEQTGKAMMEIEKALLRERPDIVFVYGDVNSTLAGALAAVKLRIKVGHVEAGLRSLDLSMPEEINRRVTDVVSDLLFTPHPLGDENLKREGASPKGIVMVGETIIDALSANLPRIRALDTPKEMGLQERQFVLVTLHRPSNVDDRSSLKAILAALAEVAESVTVVFPVHPRTRARLNEWSLATLPEGHDRLKLIEPLSYMRFVRLMLSAGAVLTDSGSIQMETSFVGTPCLTLRDNTERPYTLTEGTNKLIGRGAARIVEETRKALGRRPCSPRPMVGCDGKAGERIVAQLIGKT